MRCVCDACDDRMVLFIALTGTCVGKLDGRNGIMNSVEKYINNRPRDILKVVNEHARDSWRIILCTCMRRILEQSKRKGWDK